MRIAVYGGSFDPLHVGHLHILRYLCSSSSFDSVYMVVSPLNPLKDASREAALSRLEDARRAVAAHEELKKVVVDDIEFHLPSPHYSSDTLDELGRLHPEDSFTFVIGADNLAQIHLWHGYEHILKEFGVLVFPREGYDVRALKANLLKENPEYKIELAEAGLVNVSSTQIREAEDKGEDVSALTLV